LCPKTYQSTEPLQELIMSNSEKEIKKGTSIMPNTTPGSLISFGDFDNFFDDFLARRWPRLLDWNLPLGIEADVPKVDILDHDNEIEVQAALPGIHKDDVEVSINNQTLTIHVTKNKQEEKKEEGRYFRREIIHGESQRTLSLPENVDANNATAKFENGLLKVTIPKTEKSKRKTVAIK
jgi:HSP20 family protein